MAFSYYLLIWMMPNRWEIWYAKVKFEDNPSQAKNRPVLIIDNRQMYLLSLKITSTAPRTNCWGEYAIVKWREAGLAHQSTIRISKRLKLVNSDFINKIGTLHPYDRINVQKIMTQRKKK